MFNFEFSSSEVRENSENDRNKTKTMKITVFVFAFLSWLFPVLFLLGRRSGKRAGKFSYTQPCILIYYGYV